jgi:hypothetical protein
MMKRSKIFKFFVYFVIALFFLSIPWMYVLYFFFPNSNNQKDSQVQSQSDILDDESSWDVFEEIEKFLTSSWDVITWNVLTWNILSGQN